MSASGAATIVSRASADTSLPSIAGTPSRCSRRDPRQTKVLRLLVAGRTDAEAAAELFVSVRTVEHHVGNILGKLGVRTRTAAVSEAIARGLARVGRAAPGELA